MGVIADMIRAGVDPELVERVHQEMIAAARPVVDLQAERRRAADRERKRLRKSAESAESADVKEIPPTPPKENKPSLREGNINISRTREKRRSAIAEDAQPTPKDRDAATAAGLSEGEFRSQWAKFRDHHRAKGSLMADWPAAWRTWLGNIGQFQPARAGPPRQAPQERRNPVFQAGEELMAEYGLLGRTDEKPSDFEPQSGVVIDLRPTGAR